MAEVRKYRDGRESLTSVWDKNGNRRGFVSKDIDPDDYARSRYGVGIDEIGPYDRGYYENDINTPLGKFDYGYDGDTVFAGMTPNFYADRGPNTAWAGIGDYQLRANRLPSGALSAGLNFPDNANIPDYNRSFNTPLGALDVMTNDGNPNIGAVLRPNYYMQALANLLRGR